MEKIFEDETIVEELKKRLEAYNLEDKETEEEILNLIFASEDFKNYKSLKNPSDETNECLKKSLAVEYFKKKKSNKF